MPDTCSPVRLWTVARAYPVIVAELCSRQTSSVFSSAQKTASIPAFRTRNQNTNSHKHSIPAKLSHQNSSMLSVFPVLPNWMCYLWHMNAMIKPKVPRKQRQVVRCPFCRGRLELSISRSAVRIFRCRSCSLFGQAMTPPKIFWPRRKEVHRRRRRWHIED